MHAEAAGLGKIALFLPDLHGGGAERMMVALAGGLALRGVKVDLVVARAHGPYLGEILPEVNLVDLDTGGVLASLPRLIRYLRATRPSLAMGTLPYASLALLWACRIADPRIRVVIREANTPSHLKVAWSDFKSACALQLSRIFYARADRVVAVSHGVAEDLIEFLGLPREKVTTIYNPVVAPGILEQALEDPGHLWFRSEMPPVILSVGRLTPQKDFATLLRAFALVRERTEANLVILGEGEQRRELELLAKRLGIEKFVDMPGFTRNPFAYMSRSTLYVLSSQREGLPGALIQAIACGCPAVSTDCPSGPREVLDDGRYGSLVAVGDSVGMAAAILDSLSVPVDHDQLRARGQTFNDVRSLEAYLELFGDLMKAVCPSARRCSATKRPAGM